MPRELRTLIAELRAIVERRSPAEVSARKLGREVFAWVRSVRAEFARKGGAQTMLQWPRGTEGLPYKVSYVQLFLKYDPDIAKHLPEKQPWTHRGSAGKNAQGTAFRLIYRIAVPTIEDWMLEPLSNDITGVVRHEMEHGVQYARGEAPGAGAKRRTDTTGERNWGDIAATRGYLLDPAELEAFSTQVYLMAKRARAPVTKFIDEKVQLLIKALKRRDVAKADIDSLTGDYRKAVTQYIQKRYPTAQFRTRSGEVVLARDLVRPWW
jgi:hypothetical protein